MSQFIPAAPGWRMLCWGRENDDALEMPIVVWEHVQDENGGELVPWILGYDHVTVRPASGEWEGSLVAVNIMPPDMRFDEGAVEAVHETAKMAREWEEREHQKRQEARDGVVG